MGTETKSQRWGRLGQVWAKLVGKEPSEDLRLLLVCCTQALTRNSRMEPLDVEPKVLLRNQLCQYLYDQSKDESPLCDVSVSFSADCTYTFHKAILALQSRYFQTLFKAPFADSKAKELTIDICDNVKEPSDAIHIIVAFMYGQPFNLPAEYVSDILWVAEYLGINNCWNWCEKMLYIQLTLDNALTIWSLASMFCMTEIEQACQGILISRMQDYFLQQDVLLECDLGLLQLLPSCGFLRFVSQSARAEFIVKWGNHNMNSREDQMALLSQKWGLKKEPFKRALTQSSLTKATGADLLGKLKESPSTATAVELKDSILAYVILSYYYTPFSHAYSQPTCRYTSCNEWVSDVFVPKERRKPELLLFDPSVGIWLNVPGVLQSLLVHADWSHVYSSCLFTEKEIAVNKQTLVLIHYSDIHLIHSFSLNSSDDLAVLRYSSADNTITIFKFWPSFSKQLRNLGDDRILHSPASRWAVIAAALGESCLNMVIAVTDNYSCNIRRVYLCTMPVPLSEERCTVTVIPVKDYGHRTYLGVDRDKAAHEREIQLIVLKDKLIFSYRFGSHRQHGTLIKGRLHFVTYDITRDVFYEYPVPDVAEYSQVLVSGIPEKNHVKLLTGNTIRTLDVTSGVWQENVVLKPSPVDCVIHDCCRDKVDTTETPEKEDTEVDWNAFIKNPWCLTGECKINRAEALNTAAYCLDQDTFAWVGSPAPYVNRFVEHGVAEEEGGSSWKHLTPPPAHYIASLSRMSVPPSLLSVLEPATYSTQFKSGYRPFGMCCPDLHDYEATEVVLSSRPKLRPNAGYTTAKDN